MGSIRLRHEGRDEVKSIHGCDAASCPSVIQVLYSASGVLLEQAMSSAVPWPFLRIKCFQLSICPTRDFRASRPGDDPDSPSSRSRRCTRCHHPPPCCVSLQEEGEVTSAVKEGLGTEETRRPGVQDPGTCSPSPSFSPLSSASGPRWFEKPLCISGLDSSLLHQALSILAPIRRIAGFPSVFFASRGINQ